MTAGSVLVLIEHDRGEFADATREALTTGRELAGSLGTSFEAVALVADAAVAAPFAEEAARYGASTTHVSVDALLADYGPEAWAAALLHVVRTTSARAVLATGTDRGNEVLAHVAASADLPMVANCLSITPADGPWSITRSRWGGSLLEDCTLDATICALTIAHHSVDPRPADAPAAASTTQHSPTLDASLARTVIVERQLRDESGGATLATARVVIGGGRGVGSAEGFSVLEDLAALLGGRVGCSRAVTNSGWRNHTDQVGQTGTRIAPEIYFACGISGAIQHWVGAMASKKIIAINTDPEANMVSRADYAVIGDLHQVVPAISAEIRRRRGS
jgi:electron transfer flavoprotein alpha subunit